MTGIRSEATDQLFKALLSLNSLDECYDLFEDLCTIKELQDISQRLQVALLLDQGMKYQDIGARTGVSPATISRVNRCLVYGTGGYRKAIGKIKAAETEK
ncbi:MAG: helix-turn-helix domain-containing protein [Clostridia bacterium]|jgi:TrpR-related protein YerC/YecD|nr:helix-turn-helix domain-containing protein [Clostridia bacterium]MBR5009980.1 helix-turn-helix domain-containing protein [Clostridia bacterium]MBR6498163.1 helix-turn-helix domain-containing protein [Clostridia bacterium]